MTSPKWDGNRWRIRVMKEGRSFSFSSSVPGVKGRKEVQQKYDQWFYGEASGSKTVGRVAQEFLEDVKARRGENSEAYSQYERYIRLYIAPRIASVKICKVTLRDWQSVINEASGRHKALSEKTLKNLRGIIKGIIKFGYEDYQCELLEGICIFRRAIPGRKRRSCRKTMPGDCSKSLIYGIIRSSVFCC